MLSKSDFLLYLESPIHLWAKLNGKVTKPRTEFVDSLIEQGYFVEEVVKEFVKKYISPNFEYQKEFQTNSLSCRTDFVVKNEQTGLLDIYEVKSSTDVKQDHEYDITFQYIVTSQIQPIGNTYIIHLNREYIRKRDINLKDLFIIKEVNEIVKQRRQECETLIKQALLTLNNQTPNRLPSCLKPKDCCCPEICFPKLPEYSIFNLSNVHKQRLEELQELGIVSLTDIPDSYPLSNRQSLQLKSTKLQKEIYDEEKLKEFLLSLNYPLYFLDYESYSWPIPSYDNHRVFQNVVFQYSLHIQEGRNLPIAHKEFLSTTKLDPMSEVASKIVDEIGNTGNILVWNKQFEKECNNEMARIYPQFADRLHNINNRIVDLSDVFSKQIYVDYRFKGSWSIKNVLPVLVPDISYKQLEINNGTTAMLEWKKLVYDTDPKSKQAEDIKNNLLKYCELDTYAMFEILKFLNSI